MTFALWVLLGLLFVRHGAESALLRMAEQPELLTSTSIVHMERRPVPVPKQAVGQPEVPTLPRPAAVPAAAAPKTPPTPQASPRPTAARVDRQATTLSETLARQQAAFQRETQAINANRVPLSNATIDPNNSPRSQQTYKMDFSGLPHETGPGYGYLTPVQSWTDRGLDCYYGHYDWEYPSGGTESANIPWAFCYTPREDPIPRGLRQFPFPLPLPGYRLPAGTQLEPVEKHVYQLWLSTQQQP